MGAIAYQITSLTRTGEFPAQMASNAESVSIWWRHRERTVPLIISRSRKLEYISKIDKNTHSAHREY